MTWCSDLGPSERTSICWRRKKHPKPCCPLVEKLTSNKGASSKTGKMSAFVRTFPLNIPLTRPVDFASPSLKVNSSLRAGVPLSAPSNCRTLWCVNVPYITKTLSTVFLFSFLFWSIAHLNTAFHWSHLGLDPSLFIFYQKTVTFTRLARRRLAPGTKLQWNRRTKVFFFATRAAQRAKPAACRVKSTARFFFLFLFSLFTIVACRLAVQRHVVNRSESTSTVASFSFFPAAHTQISLSLGKCASGIFLSCRQKFPQSFSNAR